MKKQFDSNKWDGYESFNQEDFMNNINDLNNKIKQLESKVKHLNNELDLTKEENQKINQKYLEIVLNLENKVIEKNNDLLKIQQRLEETLSETELMLDYSPAMIFFKDKELKFKRVNKPFLTFFNKKSEEIINKTEKEVFNKYFFLESAEKEVLQTLQAQMVLAHRLKIQEKNYYFDIYVIPIFKTSHKVDGLLTFAKDVTKFIKTKNDNLLLLNHLNQTQKTEALGTLASGISHDFNNILSAIIGYTEISCNFADNPEKIKKYLNEVLFAANRAKDLIRQILMFSKKNNSEIIPLNLIDVFKQSMKLIRPTFSSKIEIIHKFNVKDVIIGGNPVQLQQVFLNICTNAMQAMKSVDHPKIEINFDEIYLTKNCIKNNNNLIPGIYYIISISDNGIGIPDNILDKIFDPYFTTKEIDEGTGLGLSVVMGIISQHKGIITVKSKVNYGTTFNIYLPKIDTVPVKDIQADNFYNYGKGYILFVDDEPSINEMMLNFLTQLGYTVDVFSDSIKAFEQFYKDCNKYDLIMTDLAMPKSDGFDFIKKITHINKSIPIILCTGYSTVETEEQAYKLGAKMIFKKPFDFHDLSIGIKSLLSESNFNQIEAEKNTNFSNKGENCE